MSADQISVKLTMADDLSAKAKEGKAELKRLETEMKGVRDELARTGKGADKLETLERKYREVRKEVNRTTVESRKLRNEVRQTGTQAAKSAHQATTAWQRFRKTMGSGLVAGASIAGVVYFGKRAVEAFAEAEKGQLALQMAMEKFPAVNDVTAASFANLNRELMNTTGADDDLLASAEGILARFRMTGSEIQRLIPLVNDYAIATGRDVPTAATAIGRALMGNARALKELGIDFTRTGDRSQDLEQIMGALERKVGGVGEAFGQTTAGKLAIATQNFQNLQEEIGAALVPALEGLIGVVRPAAEWFAGLSERGKQLAVAMGVIGIAALTLGPRLLALRAQLAMIRTEAALTGRTMSTSFLGIGKGGFKAAAGVAALGTAIAYASTTEDVWMEGAGHLKDYATDFERAGVAFRAVIDPSAVQRATNFAEGIFDFFAPIKTSLTANKEALAAFDKSLADLVTGGNPEEAARQFAHQYKWASAYGATTEDLMALLPGYAAAIANTATKTRDAATWTGNLAAAQTRAKDASDAFSKSLDGVNRALERRAAMDAYRQALSDFIANPTEETAAAVSSAMTTAAAAIDKPRAKAKFVVSAIDDIKRVAKDGDLKLGRNLEDSLDKARAKAVDVKTAIDSIPLQKTIDIFIRRHGRQIPGEPFACGGLVVGPGTGTSDSIPARLSNGEFVVRAAAVRAMGVDTLEQINKADRQTPTFTAPQLVTPQGTTPVAAGNSGPIVNIGEIKADAGVDVQSEILWALRRADRIRRERSAA